MACWYEGALASFDARTTGANPDQDRMVSAALVVQASPGAQLRIATWTINPGVSVATSATTVHEPSDAFVSEHGSAPGPCLDAMAGMLGRRAAAGMPLVVLNAPFGLTLLDRELHRQINRRFRDYLGGAALCVLDPQVLDGHLDRRRSGPRALVDLCVRYGLVVDAARDATADAIAALRLVRAIGRSLDQRVGVLSPAQLHARQAIWHAEQARGRQAWFAESGCPQRFDPAWPLRRGDEQRAA